MAHVRFLREAVLEGVTYTPLQEAEIPDVWVYPLLRQGLICCIGPRMTADIGTRDPNTTTRDPRVAA